MIATEISDQPCLFDEVVHMVDEPLEHEFMTTFITIRKTYTGL